MVTDEMVEKACLAYWGDKNMNSMFKGKTREGVGRSMRAALEAALSTDAEPVAHLVWMQGRRAIDDVEDYYEVARPGDKSVDGSDPFPVYAAPPAPFVTVKAWEWNPYRADLLRGIGNASYGPRCQPCADRELKAADKARAALERSEGSAVNNGRPEYE